MNSINGNTSKRLMIVWLFVFLGGILSFPQEADSKALSPLEYKNKVIEQQLECLTKTKDYKKAIMIGEAFIASPAAKELGNREQAQAIISYNIACGYALSGQKEKAFYWLKFSVDKGLKEYLSMEQDSDLASLRSDPRYSPLLNRAKSNSNPAKAQANKKEIKNEEETRETVSFLWSTPDNPYLAQMISEFGLEKVVAGAVDRFEVAKRLSRWIRTKWEHDGLAEPEKNDPISILREAATGKRFRCVEYGIVLAGALNAVGIPARQLNLMTRDVETRESDAGHVVVEAFLSDLGKWIMIDPQWDTIPTLADSPINALELGRELEHGDTNLRIITSSGTDTKEYFDWIRPYLFYLDVYLDNRYPEPATDKGLMLVPSGMPNPKVFQIKYPIKNTIYTHSEKEFYAAPTAAAPERVLLKEALIADVRQLVNYLESTHPDPYINGGGKIAFHRRVHDIIMKIPTSGLTQTSFYQLLRPLITSIQDSHTFLRGSVNRLNLPLDMSAIEEKLCVTAVSEKQYEALLGAELLAAEEIPFPELIRRSMAIVSSENSIGRVVKLWSILCNQLLLECLIPEWKNNKSIRISLKLRDGEQREFTIPVLDKEPVQWLTMPSKLELPKLKDIDKIDFAYNFMDKSKKTAYLKLKSMFTYRENFELMYSVGYKENFQEIYDTYKRLYNREANGNITGIIAAIPSVTETFRSLAKEMKKNRTSTLIIDLRNNDGGNDLLSSILCYFLYGKSKLHLLAESSYNIRKYSELFFKNIENENLQEINKDQPYPLQIGDYDFTDEMRYYKKNGSANEIEEDDYKETPTFQKEYKSGEYSGYYCPRKVLVITNPSTFSSAFYMAADLKELGASLVGIPSMQAGNCFINYLPFQLDNSHISGGISTQQSLRYPNDSEKGKILRPDYELTWEKLASYQFDPQASLMLALEVAKQ